MMQKIQITEMSKEQFEEKFDELKSFLLSTQADSHKIIDDEIYLTRKQLAKIFDVELSTIHNWVKKGVLKSYGICGRVYFKKSEVDGALIPLNR
jgi:excisionase family DNA binding protein